MNGEMSDDTVEEEQQNRMDWHSHNLLVEQGMDYFQHQNDVENDSSFSDIGQN